MVKRRVGHDSRAEASLNWSSITLVLWHPVRGGGREVERREGSQKAGDYLQHQKGITVQQIVGEAELKSESEYSSKLYSLAHLLEIFWLFLNEHWFIWTNFDRINVDYNFFYTQQ